MTSNFSKTDDDFIFSIWSVLTFNNGSFRIFCARNCDTTFIEESTLFTCSKFWPLCPSQLLSLVKTFYCCIYSWIYQSENETNKSTFFSSLTLTLVCCHPQVHSLLHSLRQLLLISEALHCKRQIIPLRNPAKPVLFAVPGSQTPPAPRPRLKGPWLMCINEVNLLATR